jgi:TRAP-type mannitol/chloroaromatic compound transport system permease small subunit
MRAIETSIKVIEAVNHKVGRSSCYLIFIFMLLMVYEVIARYFFESPTIWVHELCGFLFAAYVGLTGGWVLIRKGHVAVDIIYQFFPTKAKQMADIAVSLIGLFMFSVLFWQGYKFAWHALVTNQHSHTLFAPPLWPVKMMIPVAALLFLMQLLVDLTRSVLAFQRRSK